jgi:bacterioferritin
MAKDKGGEAVIRVLNDVLTAELTAINQYFLHGEMCREWGFLRLYKIERKHSIDEMKHAEKVMERILYLKGMPNVQRLGKINVGETVREQLLSDRALEAEAIPRLNAGILLCRDVGDNGSLVLLEEILVSEEEHIDWIDSQLQLIESVGEQNYLAQQIVET